MSGPLPDLTPFFDRYEVLARQADSLFESIKNQYPELVVCKEQCSSCCHALFDLTLVEAMYLNDRFRKKFQPGSLQAQILSEADSADRKLAKIKRKVFKDSSAGRDSNDILAEVAAISVRCPLLDKDDRCTMYESRPITCRLYGVPTAIGNSAHTCGKTGFTKGQPYPTVALDKMQHRLAQLSEDLALALGTSFSRLATMYVPVSSALLTNYDADYLGINPAE